MQTIKQVVQTICYKLSGTSWAHATPRNLNAIQLYPLRPNDTKHQRIGGLLSTKICFFKARTTSLAESHWTFLGATEQNETKPRQPHLGVGVACQSLSPLLDLKLWSSQDISNPGLGQLHKKSEASKRMVSISIKRTDSTKISRNPNDESVMKAQNKLDASSLLYASCWHHAGPVGDRQPQTLGLLRCRLRIGIASEPRSSADLTRLKQSFWLFDVIWMYWIVMM